MKTDWTIYMPNWVIIFGVMVTLVLVVLACQDPTEITVEPAPVNVECPETTVIVCERKWHPERLRCEYIPRDSLPDSIDAVARFMEDA